MPYVIEFAQVNPQWNWKNFNAIFSIFCISTSLILNGIERRHDLFNLFYSSRVLILNGIESEY